MTAQATGTAPATHRRPSAMKLARTGLLLGSLLPTLALGGCVVWHSDYDALKAQNDQMSARGKQIIASMAAKLAPTQENKLLVNGCTDNTPVGPALQRQASPRTRCCRKSAPMT